MARLRPPIEPRYLTIAAELRARIASGELRAGDTVPSTREITRRWGIAMATATRVLTALRDEGLVRALPGVGTVVAGAAPHDRGRSSTPAQRSPRADPRARLGPRLVAVAIAIADEEGLEAVSFRRIAADLGTPTMSLYRHVAGKEALVEQMLDATFARHPLPRERPPGWRAQLEILARAQWTIYRRHPWLAQALSLSFTRPLAAPHAMVHTERSLAAIDGLGLDATVMLQTAVTLAGYVHGTALKLLSETNAHIETGITNDEWMRAQQENLAAVIRSGQFPTLARIAAGPDVDMGLDALFEFGLHRLLDGVAAHFDGLAHQRSRAAVAPR
jgi:AcrR family transcriptional regulator